MREHGHGDTFDLVGRPLAAGDEVEAQAAQAELALDDFSFLLDERPGEPWHDYLAGVNESDLRRRYLVPTLSAQLKGLAQR